MEKKRTALPVAAPGDQLPVNVERFLKASGGEPLMFFDSYEALKLFFVQALQWEDEEDSLLPDLKEFSDFVMYANPKGLLIGPDVAPYFADKRNLLYNAEVAEEEAYELFCEEGLCPFDLLKYGCLLYTSKQNFLVICLLLLVLYEHFSLILPQK